MNDDPVPRRCMGRTFARSFAASITYTATAVAKAQKQNVLSKKSDDNPKTKITTRVNDITALTLRKEQTHFYNGFISYFAASRKNKYSSFTQMPNLSTFVTDNCNLKNHHAIINIRIKAMLSCIPPENGESEAAKL